MDAALGSRAASRTEPPPPDLAPAAPGALFSWPLAASPSAILVPTSAVIELTAWTHRRPHSTTGKTHTHAHALPLSRSLFEASCGGTPGGSKKTDVGQARPAPAIHTPPDKPPRAGPPRSVFCTIPSTHSATGPGVPAHSQREGGRVFCDLTSPQKHGGMKLNQVSKPLMTSSPQAYTRWVKLHK